MANRQTIEGRVAELPHDQFLSVMRTIRDLKIDSVEQIDDACRTHMERLGLRRRMRRAFSGDTSSASGQNDVRSLLDWMARITKDDPTAIDQLQQIDATVAVRCG